jgi:hypothetical protein
MSKPFVAAWVVCAAFFALAGSPALARAQAPAGPVDHTQTPRVRAVQRASQVVLDGRLDDAAWSAAPVAKDFRQQDPKEGEPATQRTEVRFLYDEEAMYIGARMYDDMGAAGVRTRLDRRDSQPEGDNILFVLDTFHDHAGRTLFWVNPSGVKMDAGQASPSADPSWDPVWEVATNIDSLGWTAELRIPFAQLRFPKDSLQSWGMQIWRYEERLNETSMWSFWGKQEAGGPTRFGHLDELRVAEHHLGLELLPYVVSRAEYIRPAQAGSPFEDDRDYGWRVGGDLKALLSSTLTLDATFNPDFGQVEVDPAVVNLSAFETFFPEKRPFFIEGSGLFGFGGFSCFFCSNVSSMSLFYSRRIGRAPQGFVSGDADYVDTPENTTILGAAKVTGRTKGGYQIGLMNAVTAAERSDAVAPDGTRFDEEVEPFTNYFVGRVKRTMRRGTVTIGGMGTSVIRSFDNDVLEALIPQHAEAIGTDWNVSWHEQRYNVQGNLAISEVTGDTAAIHRLQRSSARYFQRPDREARSSGGLFSNAYDPTATSLRGLGGYARVGKNTGEWLWESAVNFRSPAFEVNDLAFNTRSDYVWMNANVFRTKTKPTKYYRQFDIITGAQQQFNFDGDLTDRQVHAFTGGQTRNFWWLSTFFILRPETYEDRLTRGGPVVRRARVWSLSGNMNTDGRKRVVLGTNPFYARSAEGALSYSYNLDIRFKPASNISASFSPGFNRSGSTAQFVRRFTDAAATNFFGQRIVFADLDQRTLSFDTRLTATFSPTLTLELYAQPFASSGEYTNFKQFDAPRQLHKTEFDAAQLSAIRSAAGRDSVYVLDPDRNAATTNFTFANPDFNFRSLRGNAVLRWEYRPGSTLFFVWQQQRSGSDAFGDFSLSRDAGNIFEARPDNIFLVKATYWFGR